MIRWIKGCIGTRLIWVLVLLWLVGGCANQISPTGGEADKIPPTITRTVPSDQSTNVETGKVKLYFDEAIKKPTYGTEILISPLPRVRPRLYMSDNGKRLKIKFNDDLNPNTTYVITAKEIADFYAGNTLESVYTFAFSTGDQLDSMKVRGQVQSPILGKGQEDMILMLFPADSIVDNDIFLKQPDYISQTDASGKFSFQNLRDIPYKIYGVVDNDQSASYSQLAEIIAIAEDPVITFDDTSTTTTVKLYSFLPDNQAPTFSDYLWFNDSILTLEISERFLIDSLSINMADSLQKGDRPVSTYTAIPNSENTLILKASYLLGERSHVKLAALVDSLGNREDTVFQLRPSREKKPENPLMIKPSYDLAVQEMTFYSSWPLKSSDTSFMILTDTVTYKPQSSDTIPSLPAISDNIPYVNTIPYSLEINGFQGVISPANTPDPEMPYVLHIKGDVLGYEDTVFRYKLEWPDPAAYGIWSGVVTSDEYSGSYVLELFKDDKLVRTTYNSEFNYQFLAPGTYQVRVVLDEDSNRVWTPGSLDPYRLPEKKYLSPMQATVRANWSIEEDTIEVFTDIPIQLPEPDSTDTANNIQTDGNSPNRNRRN